MNYLQVRILQNKCFNLNPNFFFIISLKENKLQVLYILCHQLMSCNLMKTRIEDNLEKLKVAQKNLKIHQTSCLRRERDEIQYWLVSLVPFILILEML